MLGAMTDEPVNVGEAFRTNLQIIFDSYVHVYQTVIVSTLFCRKVFTHERFTQSTRVNNNN